MKRWFRIRGAAFLLTGIALATGIAYGQFRQQNPSPLPAHPEAEFHMARLAYYSPGCAGSRGLCNSYWSIDYPYAEAHFLPALERLTRIEASEDSAHIRLTDDELFDYPFLFIQQPGINPWNPTDDEAATLREYLLRGGFLVADDFHGEREWAAFQFAMQRVLPEFPIVDIAEDNALLNIIYDLDERTQIPGERHVNRWGGGPPSMEGPPHWRAIYDESGRMLVAINHNIDMGDAWEHADDPGYPVEMTGLAYRFGVNYVVYSMTH
jgi:hypothetical protein